MKQLLFVPALAAAAMAVIGCGRGGPEYIAVVNGEGISTEEYHSYMERMPSVMVLINNGQSTARAQVADTLGFQGLRDLINRRLLLQMAKDEGVMPTDADIEKEITFRRGEDAAFIRRLTDRGITLREIKNDLAIDIAQLRLLSKGVEITEKEVDDYIKNNPDDFTIPAQVQLYWIVVDSPRLRETVDKELEAGQNFRLVASRYSIAPGARTNNGEYPNSVMNAQFPEPVRKLVEQTPELQTTDWVQEGTRFAKFYVEQKTAPQKREIDEFVKERVRRALAARRAMQSVDINKRLEERLRTAEVEVKVKTLESMWKSMADQLKNRTAAAETDPNIATGTTPTPGANQGNEAPVGPQ